MIDDIPYDGCIYWYVSYIDDLHMLDDVILCFTLYVRLLSTYNVGCFRSDIPTMIIPMISSVTWDV